MRQQAKTAPARAWPWFVGIVLAAFLLRVLYLVQARTADPLFFAPQMDALYHHRWALAIAAGRQFINDAFFRAPLYPYFLGLVYRVFGPDLFAARLAQALLGSLSCGLLYLLGRRVLANKGGSREGVARAAGLALAAYPLAIWFDAELLIPVLLVALVLLGLLLFYRSLDTDRHWWLPGLALGAAAIARPNVLAAVAVLLGWLGWRYRRGAWKRAGLLAAGVAVCILPVTVRNWAVSRTFVPIAWQAGTNFYIGNNPDADGVTAVLPGTRAGWWTGYNDVRRLAELAAGRPLKGAEIDRYWLGRGLDFVVRDPGRAAGLLARKTWLLLAGVEPGNNRDIYFFARRTWLGVLLFRTGFLKFPFGLVLPLAVAGAWLLRRRRGRLAPVYLFLASYGLSFVLFFVNARFRMPMVPLFLLLACAGAAGLVRARGRERWTAIGLAAATFLLFNLNLFGAGRAADPAQNHLAVATGLHETGRDREALVELQRALARDSAVNVLTLESSVLQSAGLVERARAAAQAAVRRFPQSAEAHGALGNVLAATGQLDSARACYKRAIELDPYAVEAWNNLGNIALSAGDRPAARRCYERALAIDPGFATALFHLGLVEYQEGDRQSARERWRLVLKLDPGNARALRALEQLR